MRQSQTVSVSVRAGCAGRQRAVRQHCVPCYVRTEAAGAMVVVVVVVCH